ncbi:hypothetical protein B0H11DRAFT_2224508 [Mycena galericulata]|nr:hypothetical protein B0H11DRAFT_2227575 [Mycena galericulata]KAJ7501633.1 hypothetical protein B0H11DRAFT_2224508 [Mycena galericulata]
MSPLSRSFPSYSHSRTPADSCTSAWNNVKQKVRRPFSSIILQKGFVNALVRAARELITRRTASTIYAHADTLTLEIYSQQ